MTDKFIFPDDTVCLFYLQVIENTSDWNLLIRKVQIKIDRWIFSAVLAQKNPRTPQNLEVQKMTSYRASYLKVLFWTYWFQIKTLATTLKAQIRLRKFKLTRKNGINYKIRSFFERRHIPLSHLLSQKNASRLIVMNSCREYWSTFSGRSKYKFSASKVLIGYFYAIVR